MSNLNQTQIKQEKPVATQDFPEEGAPTPKLGLFYKFFAENCLKMKEFGPQGVRVPGAPLDPPMETHCKN